MNSPWIGHYVLPFWSHCCYMWRIRYVIFLLMLFQSFLKALSLGHRYIRCLSILLRRPLLPVGFNSGFRFTSGVLHCFIRTAKEFLRRAFEFNQSYWVLSPVSFMGYRHSFLQFMRRKIRAKRLILQNFGGIHWSGAAICTTIQSIIARPLEPKLKNCHW